MQSPPQPGTVTDGAEQSAKLEMWIQAREQIVHEDNLINQRLSWMVSAHGLLLAAAVAALVYQIEHRPFSGSTWSLMMMVGLGVEMMLAGLLWMALVTSYSVRAAHTQIAAVAQHWYNAYPNEWPSNSAKWKDHSDMSLKPWKSPPPVSEPSSESRSQPEFPPIIGHVRHVSVLQSSWLPLAFLSLDGAAFLGGLVVLCNLHT